MRHRKKEVPVVLRYIYYAVIVLLLIWIGFTGRNSFWKTVKLKKELQVLEQETLRLKAINDSLQLENQRLKTDPQAAEKAAREQFGFTKPGEQVFRFVPALEEGK